MIAPTAASLVASMSFLLIQPVAFSVVNTTCGKGKNAKRFVKRSYEDWKRSQKGWGRI